MQVINDGTGVKTPVSLGLRLDGVVQSEQANTCACMNDKPVEGAIQLEDICGVSFASCDCLQAGVKFSQLSDDALSFSFGFPGYAASGDTFKSPDK